jgi:hypothetical protein
VQAALAEVADQLGLDGWAVCLAVNVDAPDFVRAVEQRADALRAEYALADADIEL